LPDDVDEKLGAASGALASVARGQSAEAGAAGALAAAAGALDGDASVKHEGGAAALARELKGLAGALGGPAGAGGNRAGTEPRPGDIYGGAPPKPGGQEPVAGGVIKPRTPGGTGGPGGSAKSGTVEVRSDHPQTGTGPEDLCVILDEELKGIVDEIQGAASGAAGATEDGGSASGPR
jgi:hypothetical protein